MFCGDLNGKEIQKRGDMCIHIADSLRRTAETNTTLQSNYTPIKEKKADALATAIAVKNKLSFISEKKKINDSKSVLLKFL